MNIKYGLIAILPSEEIEMMDVVHFCGYEELPPSEEIKEQWIQALYDELANDPELGLMDQIQQIQVIESPAAITEEYANIVANGDLKN